MPLLTVTDTNGVIHVVEGAVGRSMMELIRAAGFDDLLALCGGCCSCATCHVIVNDEDFSKVGPAKAEEEDLLDGSDQRTPTSRLSCQIPFTAELDGVRVTIAKEA